MKAIIMVGGGGSRLKPYTETIPKPLWPIKDGKTVLEIIIEKLKIHSFNEIYLATNYKADLFEAYFGDGNKFGIKIGYSKEQIPLGTAGPLELLVDKLKEDFLVINGDIITDLDFTKLREFHLKNNADLTLTIKKIVMPLEYGIVTSENEIVKSLIEKPNIEHEVLAGIYMLKPNVLSYIPKNKKYMMTELINDLLNDSKKVIRYLIEDYWLDIGQLDSYQKGKEDLLMGKVK